MSNLPDLSGRTILQIIPELAAGGAERSVIETASAITKAGGKALVASTGGRLEPELEAAGGELIDMPVASKNPFTIYRNISALTELVKTRTISLIHARSRAPAWSALYAARRARIPFVTTYHGAYSGNSKLKLWYNSIMTRGDLVIANSGWTGAHIRETHDISNDRIVVIPSGVDFTRFNPEAVPQTAIDALREAWGIGASNQRLILLLPARFTEWKGQILALKALALLSPEEQEECILVLVGDAQGRQSYITELEKQIAADNLAPATRIASHCSDMPAAMLLSDMVLAPSLKPEAFGRTAAEAAAMTRPVIAADHGGARETVIDGETGARFEPGNERALAGAIRSLISIGPVARASMGRAGQAYVLQQFAQSGLQAATLSVYTALITQGKLNRL